MVTFETVMERAVEVLGSEQKAQEWMTTTSRTLGGKPAVVAATQAGIERVLRHLHSIEIQYPE